jgi:predicted nuclease of restriction endonuclease-like (RecB) superfamily
MKKRLPVPSVVVKGVYADIRAILDTARGSAYRSVNFIMIEAYWFMRQFHMTFPILDALRRELTWTHYRLLLRIEKPETREFYMKEAVENRWSTRQLERQINSFYFERLLSSKDKRSVRKEAESGSKRYEPRDVVKDPYVLEFLDMRENRRYLESELEQALIDKLEDFLLELGKGFSFVSRQKRITAEGEHFYIDLVFYNFHLKCFLLIDLKVGKLTHQDIGQMDFYVRYYEENERAESDNPTIGLILCSEKNEAIVKYSVLKESRQLFASRYKLYMPSETELRRELESNRAMIEEYSMNRKPLSLPEKTSKRKTRK